MSEIRNVLLVGATGLIGTKVMEASRELPWLHLIALTRREQTQAHGLIAQFKSELRPGGVRDTKLFPIRSIFPIGPAQMGQEAMAQLADRQEGLR